MSMTPFQRAILLTIIVAVVVVCAMIVSVAAIVHDDDPRPVKQHQGCDPLKHYCG